MQMRDYFIILAILVLLGQTNILNPIITACLLSILVIQFARILIWEETLRECSLISLFLLCISIGSGITSEFAKATHGSISEYLFVSLVSLGLFLAFLRILQQKSDLILNPSLTKVSSVGSVVLCDIVRDGDTLDYRIIEMNQSLEKVMKIERTECIGKLGSSLKKDGVCLPFEDMSIFARVAETGSSESFDMKYDGGEGQWYHVAVFRPAPNQFAAIFLDVTDQMNAKTELSNSNMLLHERMKELTMLYSVTEYMNSGIDEMMEGVVKMLPWSMQYVELCAARIIYKDQEYKSENWTDSGNRLSCEIKIEGSVEGRIEVVYIGEGESSLEWLAEEQKLLEEIGWKIGSSIKEKRLSELSTVTLNSIGDAVIATDTEGRITQINREAVRMCGWTEAEAVGRKSSEIFNIINAFTGESIISPVDRVLREGIVVGLANHTVLLAKDGTAMYISDCGAPIMVGKEMIGTVLCFRDTTQEYEARAALEASETRFRQLHSTMVGSVVMCDIVRDGDAFDYRIIEMNQSLEKVMKIERTECIGKLGSSLKKDGVCLPFEDMSIFARVAETGSSESFDMKYDGEGQCYHVAVFRPAPNQFAAIFLDVTEKEKSNSELQRMYEVVEEQVQLRTSELDEALKKAELLVVEAQKASVCKDRFLASMSHELRTPLSSIVACNSLLKRSIHDEDLLDLIRIGDESSQILLEIIGNILDFSKIESGKSELFLTRFSIRECISSVMSILRSYFNSEIELKSDIKYDVPEWIVADHQRIKQVILNFGSNAIKYTPAGSVTVRVECMSPKADPSFADSFVLKKENSSEFGDRQSNSSNPGLSVKDKNEIQDNTTLLFSVIDTGVGIGKDDYAQLFKPFSQLDAVPIMNQMKGSTSGLGLAISKKLVSMMDGTIGCKGSPGKGTTFFFAISVLKVSTGPDSTLEPIPEVPAAELTSCKILLVEDNPVNRKVIKMQLEKIGYNVTAVADGKLAVDALFESTNKESNDLPYYMYSLVLMDCQMPVMDGFEATEEIRKRESELVRKLHIPIIALTAFALSEVRERCLMIGMDSFLAKPLTIERLKNEIEFQLSERKI